jgi:hypothetical protein
MATDTTVTKKKKLWLTGAAAALVLVAAYFLFSQVRPPKQANLNLAYYSDDDGQSWFSDSNLLIPPFDHNGKQAVSAQVYTYAGGSKKFCAYLLKYTPSAKVRLDEQVAESRQKNDSGASLTLFLDNAFLQSGTQVKLPGPNNPWVTLSDPKSNAIVTVKSPDGTPTDQAFVY